MTRGPDEKGGGACLGNTTEFERLRRKRRRARNLRRLALTAVLLTVAAVGVVAADKVYRWDIGTRLSNLMSSLRPGGGFPVVVDDLDVLQLLPIGKDVAVVSGSGTYIYNSKGARLAIWPNSYNEPISKSGGGKLLTYDLGGTRLRVDSKSEQVASLETEGRIFAADIAENGGLVVASGTRGHLVKVTAYDPRCAEMYAWYTSACYIHDVAMSRDGEKFAVAGLNAGGGRLTAQLRVHHTALDEAEAEVAAVQFPDEMILSLRWTAEDNIQVITDRALYVFDKYGVQKARVEAPGDMVTFDNCASGGFYIAYGDYREERGTQVLAYGPGLEFLGSTSVDRKILSIQYVSNGHLLLLTEGKLYLADRTLSEVKERKADDLYFVCGVGSSIYGITPDGLIRTGL